VPAAELVASTTSGDAATNRAATGSILGRAFLTTISLGCR
jgi:hypothetical protein